MPYLKTVTDQPAGSGTEIGPDDAEWDRARAPWNRAIDQHPRAVVHPQGIDDLRRLLDRAVTDDLTLTTQPNGHGAAGDLRSTLLIRPDAFQEIRIDVDRRIARVGAGVSWGRLLHRLDGTGLIAPAGSHPGINVVGYLLAGGHSWFGRRTGQAARCVRAVEIVLPDGDHRRVGPDDPDLFWALRGAGGDLGVVTAIEFALMPAAPLLGGSLLFPGERAAQVLDAALDVAAAAPEHFSLQATLVRMPDLPQVPLPLRGRSMVQVAVVTQAEDPAVDRALATLRSAGTVLTDSVGSLRIQDLGAVAAEPTEPSAHLTRAYLADLDSGAVAGMLETLESPAGQRIAGLQFRPLGGALGRSAPGDGIAGAVDAQHLVQALVPVPDHRPDPGAAAALEAVRIGAGQAPRPGLIATFLAPGQTWADAYDAASVERLQVIKSLVDPLGLIRGNREIPSPRTELDLS